MTSRNNSPNYKNNILKSSERNKYISKLEKNLGYLKKDERTPIRQKLMENYEKIMSNVPTRYIYIFSSLFFIVFIILYLIQPNFVLKKELPKNDKMNITSKKNIQMSSLKKISYIKFTLYCFLITFISFIVLFLFRKNVNCINNLFNEKKNIQL